MRVKFWYVDFPNLPQLGAGVPHGFVEIGSREGSKIITEQVLVQAKSCRAARQVVRKVWGNRAAAYAVLAEKVPA